MLTPAEKLLHELLAARIVLLDGAMGTMIQRYKLDEAAYRGERFKDWPRDVKGNNDLLVLTQPDVIREIHGQYVAAGADIIETNTFSSTTIAQADYGMGEIVPDINRAAARVAREAADACKERRVFVAGAIGPLNRTLSISRDVNDPGKRDVTFEQVAAAYRQQVEHLVGGGVDILLVETIFDTLNAKAALFAIADYFEAAGHRIPVMVSGTITDLSGRTLTGQTVEAFLNSVSHFPLLSIGLNCALGPREMRPYIEELSTKAPFFVSTYPNAGLPDPLSETGFPETPGNSRATASRMGRAGLAEHSRRLLRNHARPYPRHRGGRPGPGPKANSRAAAHPAFERVGSFHCAPGNPIHQHRRADQCHGLSAIRQVDPCRQLR